MKFKTNLLIGALSFFVLTSYAQRHETKHEKDIFNRFKSKAKTIAQNDSTDLLLRKVCITTSSASVIYTRSDDHKNLFSSSKGSRRGGWQQDTVVFEGSVDRIMPNENLAVYKLFLKGSRYQYLMFGGRDTIFCSILNDNGTVWSNQKLISRYRIGKIGGVAFDNDAEEATTYAFFVGCQSSLVGQPCCREDNVVMSLSTSDNAERWSNPAYEIKHNEVSFDNISIAEISRKSRKNKELYMILSEDKNTIPYFSKSFDGGQTWSYPKQINHELYGYGHKIVMEKERIYISFKKMESEDKPSDIYLWQGNVRDIEKGNKGKLLVKITDYDQLPPCSFEERNRIDASSNIDIVSIGKKKVYLAASAKWSSDMPIYILGILVDLKNINQE